MDADKFQKIFEWNACCKGGARQKLQKRNQRIYDEYKSGRMVANLLITAYPAHVFVTEQKDYASYERNFENISSVYG